MQELARTVGRKMALQVCNELGLDDDADVDVTSDVEVDVDVHIDVDVDVNVYDGLVFLCHPTVEAS